MLGFKPKLERSYPEFIFVCPYSTGDNEFVREYNERFPHLKAGNTFETMYMLACSVGLNLEENAKVIFFHRADEHETTDECYFRYTDFIVPDSTSLAIVHRNQDLSLKDLINYCVTTRFENTDTSHPYIQIVVNTPEMDSYFGIRMNMPLTAG